jgi:hypothetical protein
VQGGVDRPVQAARLPGGLHAVRARAPGLVAEGHGGGPRPGAGGGARLHGAVSRSR